MKRVILALAFASVLTFAQEAEPKHEVGVPNATTAREVEDARVNETNELLYKWLDFAILFGVLAWVAVKYGGPFFRSRTHEIRKGIEDAARVKAEAEARAAEIEQRIRNMGTEIEELRRTSTSEMQTEAERIRQETATEMAKMKARAEQEITSAAKLATHELKAYAADLALNLAEQQIRSRMNSETEGRLVKAFLRDLEDGSKAAVS